MNNFVIALVGGLLGMLGYGISDFAAKKAIDKIGNLKTLFYTQLLGVVFLLLYFVKDTTLPLINANNIFAILIFGLFNTIGYLALYKAFEVGKLSIVSPISSSYAILAAIVSFVFFGEIFSTYKIAILSLILLGILLTAIDLKSLRDGLSKKDLLEGVPEALTVLFIFGIYAPFWDKFISEPGWIFWVILIRLIMAAFLIIYQMIIKKNNLSVKGSKFFYLLIFVSFFEAVGSFGSSWGYHFSVSTTSIVAAVTSTYPLVTAILAFTFLKERLAVNQYIGITLIIFGLVLSPFV